MEIYKGGECFMPIYRDEPEHVMLPIIYGLSKLASLQLFALPCVV